MSSDPSSLHLEVVLLLVFGGVWAVAALLHLSGGSLAGAVPLGVYPFYSLAAALGWLSGNLLVWRRRKWANSPGWLWVVYLFGPPSVLFLLWALVSPQLQRAAPFVPIYAYGVFVVLFLVPVSFARSRSA